MYEGNMLVVSMSIKFDEDSDVDFYFDMQLKLPSGVDFCGLFRFDHLLVGDPPETTIKELQEVFITDNPIFLQKSIESPTLRAFMVRNQRLNSTDFEVITQEQFLRTFVGLRIKVSLPFCTALDQQELIKEIDNLQKMVASGGIAFEFHGAKLYINGGDSDYDIGSDMSIGDLYDSVSHCIERRLEKGILEVSVLLKSSTVMQDDPEFHAPVISATYNRCRRLEVLLPVDAMCLVQRSRMTNDVYDLLVDSVCRSINLFQNHIPNVHHKPERLRELRYYHFFPKVLGHFFTMIYPDDKKDEHLREVRNKLHKQLCLPMDVPLFRKGNGLIFKPKPSEKAILSNVHVGLRPSGVQGGKLSLVKGIYTYHHYLQDKFDDNGWGCAYRSLQTLFSWFRWQGYTNLPIPKHKEIQKCLVDIQDKPPNFVGSKFWIGSAEVAFCLEAMLGISSRILTVPPGEELDSQGNELWYHFEVQGTPVMIGGGVLAHTILGVDYNQETGDVKFLVLDPHYTGIDEMQVIQKSGGVGWKSKDFWDKKTFYNMCLPQRPLIN